MATKTRRDRAHNARGASGFEEDFGPPAEDRVSFRAHRVNAKLAQIANRLFRSYGIDVVSSRILVFLLQRRDMRVGELVDLMALPQSTISHQLQRLDKCKFIRRRRTAEDNRAVSVALTPLGRAVARECNEFSLSAYRFLQQRMGARGLTQLGALLADMFDALSAFGDSRDNAGPQAQPRRRKAPAVDLLA